MENKKAKAQKVVTIEGEFQELKGGQQIQTGRGVGGSIKTAGAAAFRNLFTQPKLKGKRVTMFRATVSIGTIRPEDLTLSDRFDQKENQ